jgi:RHS repeat-associated protein
MTSAGKFSIRPTDLHSSGDQLGTFGDQIAKGGDELQDIGEHLTSHTSSDKSGVGKIISNGLGRASETLGKVFSQGGRVAGQAGKRLHFSASNHEQNESDLTGSFNKIRQPPNADKTPHPGGSGSSGGGERGLPGKGAPDEGPAGRGSAGKGAPDDGSSSKGLPDEGKPDEGSTRPSSSGDQGPSDIKSHNDKPETNNRPTDTRPSFADPIDVTTGRMMLTQTDVELAGVLALVVSRTHVSSYGLGRWFGAAWASTVDQRLEVDDERVHFAGDDGILLTFPRPVPDLPPVPPLSGPRRLLSRADDGSYSLRDPDSDRTLFFAPHQENRLPVTGITDGQGHTIRFDYRGDTLTCIDHSAGYRIAVDTEDGLITALRLLGDGGSRPDVVLVGYAYDELRRLVEVTNSSGRPLRFAYDDTGRVVRWDDRNGMWYRYIFDAAGRCVRAEGADGYLDATFAYDTAHRVTTATDSLGHSTTFELNERLQVVRQTDPLNGMTVSEWNVADQLLSSTDALGRTTRYDYDEEGRLTARTRPDGSREIAEYGRWRLPVTVIEPDGGVWRREFTDTGAVAAVIDPSGARTAYGYDDAGHLSSITDALGNTTLIVANAAGLPVSVTDPQGATTRYDYDQMGRARTVTDPLGGTTHLSWTVEGKPLAQVTPDGAVRRWNYDGEGNARESIDPQGAVTRVEIAHFDLPVAQIAPDGGQLRYAYDTELRLTSVTNEQGRAWRYEYDAAGRLVTETDFDGRVLHYVNDAAGQLLSRTNALGQSVRTTWDVLGRVATRQVGEEVTTFAYDTGDRMLTAHSADVELVFTYDRLGRPTSETSDGRTLISTYDAVGRRVRRHTPSGAESVWEYDRTDRPLALHSASQTVSFRRDAAGREVERRVGTGVLLTQTWNAHHRLTSQTLAVSGRPASQSRRYGYRQDGLLSSVDDQLSGGRRYDVDGAGRVTAVRGTGWSERYAYDPAGNLTHAGWPVPPQGSPDAAAIGERDYAGTLITRAGTVTYEHDAEGRMVSRHRGDATDVSESWCYTWDADDRLTAVRTPDGQRWRYRYDPLGRRVAKQRLTPDGALAEQVTFTWDGDLLVEQVHNDTHAITWDWEPDTFRAVSQRERAVQADVWVDQRFFAIVTDVVGTPTELVDPWGNLAWHADATLWGSLLSRRGAAYTPLRFPGQYHDAETGLHYNRHRYYDPATGRYTTHDPLGQTAAPNTRAYVDNPTGWIDPLGLAPCPVEDLHRNPAGPSLRFTGPGKNLTTRPSPNKIDNKADWNTLKAGSPSRLPGRPVRIDQHPQTFAESHQAAANAGYKGSPMPPVSGGRSQILEAMGRRDPSTASYWQKQDERDERLGNDANDISAANPRRGIADKAHDGITLAGANDKMAGVHGLLQDNKGVIIGTKHGSDDAHGFLKDNMGNLHASGVRTIYMENIRDDAHQGMLNDYMKTGNMHPDLKTYLDKSPDMRDTITSARQHGVDVQGIGGTPARTRIPPPGAPNGTSEHVRAVAFNTYGSQAINMHQASLGSNGGKWVAEVGAAHGWNHEGVPGATIGKAPAPQNFPGMGDILNVPVVKTDPNYPTTFHVA